ncbi:MAG: hypothetical protein AB7K86_08530 [Rhodospirillales bacterium]
MTEVTFAISWAALSLIGLSAALFIGVTVLCRRAGFFEADNYGIGALFALGAYSVLWAIPTLIAWAVWATWLR